MEQKIIEMLSQMQGQMNHMQQDISEVKSDITNIKTDVSELKVDVSDLKTDVSSIKETVIRIEEQQNEDIIALLNRIDEKTEVLKRRQEESDNVIDLLAARTIRLEAKKNSH